MENSGVGGWVGGWSGGVAEPVEVVYTDTNTAIHPSTPNQISPGQNLIIKHPPGVSKSDGTAALKYLLFFFFFFYVDSP